MSDDAARRAWVTRVLKADLSRPASGTSGDGNTAIRPPADVSGIWVSAKDQVDKDLEALRHAFMATGHRLARDACEKGLGALTSNWLVPFQVAIREYAGAGDTDRDKRAQQLRAVAAELQQAVESSALLEVFEENPYSVKVSIRATMRTALSDIRRVLG